MSPAKTTLLTGTTPATGAIFAVQVVADAVFSDISGSVAAAGLAGDSYAGVTFPAGQIIFGNFTGVTLASGKVLCYHSNVG